MRTHGSLTVDVVKGAVAGAAGTWVMTQVKTWMYARENEAAKTREDIVREGETVYERTAERASEAVDTSLTDEQRRQIGTAVRWATGIAAGSGIRRRPQTLAWGPLA